MSTALPMPASLLVRRRATRRWRRPVLAFGRPRPDVDEPFGGPVVTLTVDHGCDVDAFAALTARLLGAPVLDAAVPELVAEDLGIPVDDARQLDGTAPSPLLQAVVWTGTMAPVPELIGAVAAADLVTRCFHQTQEVLRAAALRPEGAVLVGRGAAFLLAGHPAACHVRVSARPAWRAERLAGALGIDVAAAGERVAWADASVARYARHGYRADPDDGRHFHLVLDAEREPVGPAAALAAAAARQRHGTAAPGGTRRG